MMTGNDALAEIIGRYRNNPIVFTTGYTCRRAYSIADRPQHFYMVGSMGLASSVGVGIAMAIPGLKVVVVDGDGSLLMNPTGPMLLPLFQNSVVHHIVLDNGTYESTGGQPSNIAAVDVEALARGIGYPRFDRTDDRADLRDLLIADTARTPAESRLTHCRVRDEGTHPGGRIEISLPEVHRRFAGWLEGAAA